MALRSLSWSSMCLFLSQVSRCPLAAAQHRATSQWAQMAQIVQLRSFLKIKKIKKGKIKETKVPHMACNHHYWWFARWMLFNYFLLFACRENESLTREMLCFNSVMVLGKLSPFFGGSRLVARLFKPSQGYSVSHIFSNGASRESQQGLYRVTFMTWLPDAIQSAAKRLLNMWPRSVPAVINADQGPVVTEFHDWWSQSFMHINSSKTKEMLMGFHKCPSVTQSIVDSMSVLFARRRINAYWCAFLHINVIHVDRTFMLPLVFYTSECLIDWQCCWHDCRKVILWLVTDSSFMK